MTLDTYKPEFSRAVEFLKRELATIHTGRATPALVEDVHVDVYGNAMSVKQLASIGVADARTLVVDPWDKAILKDLEKAIRLAQPNLNPVNDGKLLRIPMPQLTEDARRNLTKLISQKAESAKQSIHQVRDRARSAIVESERAKAMSEDDRFRLQKKLDEMTQEHTAKLKELAEQKATEVMTM